MYLQVPSLSYLVKKDEKLKNQEKHIRENEERVRINVVIELFN